MEQIIELAQQNPLVLSLVIIGGLLHVLFLTLKSSGVLDKVFKTQQTKMSDWNEALEHIKLIGSQTDLLLNNHMKHEIPEIIEGQKTLIENQKRHENKLDKINDTLIKIEAKM